MWGRAQQRCTGVLIQAVAIVLFAGVSVPRAAEPTEPGLPGKEQATPIETMAVDAAPANVPAIDAAPANLPTAEATADLSEEILSASTAHAIPCQHHPYGALSCVRCCRTGRIYRSNILGRLWVRGEYLAWVPKGVDLPSLVTGSPLAAPSSTTVLFGNEKVFQEMSSGGRLTGGFWWTPQRYGGIEASYFELDGNDQGLYASADHEDTTIIARPFLDVQTGLPSQALTAYPGVLKGAIDIRADMELSGAECLWRQMLISDGEVRLDFIAGYRYGRLNDRIKSVESMSFPDPLGDGNDPLTEEDTGTFIRRIDSLNSANDFHGGELGLLARWERNCWSLDVTGKFALGSTTTSTDIGGSTRVIETLDGIDVSRIDYAGGLLALPSNMGRYREGRFAVMSEVEIVLRRELVCNLWFRCGYNLLAWSRVGRAADQIDLGINPSQMQTQRIDDPDPPPIVGQARPTFTPTTTSFWAQGLNIGVEYQF